MAIMDPGPDLVQKRIESEAEKIPTLRLSLKLGTEINLTPPVLEVLEEDKEEAKAKWSGQENRAMGELFGDLKKYLDGGAMGEDEDTKTKMKTEMGRYVVSGLRKTEAALVLARALEGLDQTRLDELVVRVGEVLVAGEDAAVAYQIFKTQEILALNNLEDEVAAMKNGDLGNRFQVLVNQTEKVKTDGCMDLGNVQEQEIKIEDVWKKILEAVVEMKNDPDMAMAAYAGLMKLKQLSGN